MIIAAAFMGATTIFSTFSDYMLITLYKSALCPRCYLAKKSLLDIIEDYPDCQIEEVDVLTSPLKAFHAGITMIPAITIGEQKLSSIYLTRKDIDTFIDPFLP